ncbi:hypothetical protein CLV56_1907 [Mumia flava]|uniref:Uncharacterized protein n=1 Tax=Mumia flava TaxID=1348852 RepID=A0A2M9BIA8_9ACTN|nr:hypothetical protein [Mumia flava]PJJ57669.1 hypothetical protein CLV56_1907 [Mumia flava]
MVAPPVDPATPVDRCVEHRWWTPLRLLLITATLVCTLGLVTKAPCAVDDGARWFSDSGGAARLCASDLPAEYATSGLAEGTSPWGTDGGRWPAVSVSGPVGALQVGTAAVTRVVFGVDEEQRAAGDASRVEESPEVAREAVVYTGLVSVLLVVLLLLALGSLGRAALTRARLQCWPPWVRPVEALMPIAAAPLLVVLVGVGWDLLGVAITAAALAAWTRGRAATAGALLGLGTAAAGWPALVAVALVAAALLRHGEAVGRLVGTALAVVAAITLPALVLTGGDAVIGPLRGWIYDDDPVGSVWALLAEVGVSADERVVASLVIGLAAFAVCATFAWTVRGAVVTSTARVAFVLLAVVLGVGASYEPGYALWLLVPAVLARPAWRDLLVWQAAEIFAVCATWWHVAGTNDATSDGPDAVLVVAIALRIVVTAWFAVRLFTADPPQLRSDPPALAGARPRPAVH